MKKNRTRMVAQAGVIAALYVVLTYVSSLFGLSSGVIQCRLSEALCVLPAFTISAVPGLFAGCLIANIVTGSVAADVVFGSIATLVGAVGTYLLRKRSKYLYPLPAIVANTVIVPFIIKFAYGSKGTLWYFAATVGAGEIISCGVFGLLLYLALEKRIRSIIH